MNVLAAISRERRRLERQLRHLQHRVDALHSAAKALELCCRAIRRSEETGTVCCRAREDFSSRQASWSRVRAAQKVERVSRSSKTHERRNINTDGRDEQGLLRFRPGKSARRSARSAIK